MGTCEEYVVCVRPSSYLFARPAERCIENDGVCMKKAVSATKASSQDHLDVFLQNRLLKKWHAHLRLHETAWHAGAWGKRTGMQRTSGGSWYTGLATLRLPDLAAALAGTFWLASALGSWRVIK